MAVRDSALLTRLRQFFIRTTVPADAELANSEVALYLDSTASAPKVMGKGKDSAGTVFIHDLSSGDGDLSRAATRLYMQANFR